MIRLPNRFIEVRHVLIFTINPESKSDMYPIWNYNIIHLREISRSMASCHMYTQILSMNFKHVDIAESDVLPSYSLYRLFHRPLLSMHDIISSYDTPCRAVPF